MMRVPGHALMMAVLLAGCSAQGQSNNPLLGKWKAEPNGFVDRNGFAWCEVIPEIDFGPTTQTVYTAATKFRPAAHGTTTVIYLVAGPKVYVSSTPGFVRAPMYTMINANEMQDSGMGSCKYRRM